MRTVLVYLLAFGALTVAAVFGFPELLGVAAVEPAAGAERPPAEAPAVIVAPVARAPFADSLEALGTVLANESVELTPNRADHVAAIHFGDGQHVERGELLVEMNAEEEKAQLAEAAAIRDERKVHHERTRQLYDEGLSAQQDLDNARALLDAAEARVIALEAAIRDREVRAPFAGTLGLRRVSVGAYVQPSTVITTLDDLSVVKLDFTIPETWLSAVGPGMAIRARSDAWPGEVFVGEVVTVDTRLERSTRSATVRAELPNPERKLRPGMLLKVDVDRGEEPVLQIPEEALIPVADDQFVFRVDRRDVARRVRVEIGRRRVGAVEVLDGLEEGDRVVVEGVVRVRPDAEVRVVATRAPKP